MAQGFASEHHVCEVSLTMSFPIEDVAMLVSVDRNILSSRMKIRIFVRSYRILDKTRPRKRYLLSESILLGFPSCFQKIEGKKLN